MPRRFLEEKLVLFYSITQPHAVVKLYKNVRSSLNVLINLKSDLCTRALTKTDVFPILIPVSEGTNPPSYFFMVYYFIETKN